MYTIGRSVQIIATGAIGTICGVEASDDGSYTYKVKYMQVDGNVVREWFAATQFTVT